MCLQQHMLLRIMRTQALDKAEPLFIDEEYSCSSLPTSIDWAKNLDYLQAGNYALGASFRSDLSGLGRAGTPGHGFLARLYFPKNYLFVKAQPHRASRKGFHP